MTRKLGATTDAFPPKREEVAVPSSSAALDRFEVQSEFSAVTNESEVKPDENVLDFVIQDAEYYFDAFKTVLDPKELAML